MSIENNAVEQITVNPDQIAQVVKNEDKFENTRQLNVAVFDPSVVTTKTNKTLDDLADWKEFQHDPWKAMESGEERFEKYKPVADLSRDPVWYSLTQKYGRDIVDKTNTLLEYKDGVGLLGRIAGGYGYASDNLKLADARKRLSDANMAGNIEQAKKIENEIAELKYRLANVDRPFKSETAGSLMDVAASVARTMPEVLITDLAATAAAAPTLGWSVPTGRAAVAAEIYNDTYNIEFGGVLHDIMTANPNIPEAEARRLATETADVNAKIEAAAALIPLGNVAARFGGRFSKAALSKGARTSFRETLKQLAARDPAAARKVLTESAKLIGETGIGIASDSTQEMIQNVFSDAAVQAAVSGGDVTQISEERLLNFIRDPFSEENADMWQTFGYTAKGVGAFEILSRLVTGGVGAGARRVRGMRRAPTTTEQRATGATANATLADRLFKHRQESNVAQQSPELTDRANQAMVDRGVVPEKIYIDKDMVEQLLADNNVQEAISELQLRQAYEDSQTNGGVVEVDFTKYDNVINTNEELYQRVKNAISFSPETLSLNQFQAYIDSLDAKAMNEIERARQSTDSFYNRVYNMMMQLHNDEKLAQAQAIQAQMMANRVGAFRLGQPRTGEEIASRLEIRLPGATELPPEGGRVLRQFIGEGANLGQEAPELGNRLLRAKEMKTEGKTDKEIFAETHVHIGPDGRLRVQISDKDAKIKNLKQRKDGRLQAVDISKGMTLGDIIDHPLLFALYPRLKNVPVQIKGNSSYVSQDAITGDIKFINFRTSEGVKSLRHSVLHEIQHAIQNIERWARGGQPKGKQASGSKIIERYKLLREISPKLKDAGVGTYWAVTTGGKETIIEPDEFRAIQDSPAVKELAAKDKDFADKVERLKTLNDELEYADRSDSRVKYMRLFGEAEARLTEKLASKSQEELEAIDPYGYFDVTEFILKDQTGSYLDTKIAPANTQATGEFEITLSPEATEAVTGGPIAGTFFREGDKLVISLSPDANPTTLTHELFHWFSYELQSAYNSGEMTDYWKGKAEALAKMVDAKIEDGQIALTASQEERAADMFLEYIREGKVENEAVKPLFAYLQTLFKSVFNLLGLRQLKLNKASEELFGSIFRAQDVIEDEQRLAGILAIEKPEGVDQGLYDMYIGEMLNSRIRGTQELHKKWALIEKFRKSEEYDRLRNDTRLDVADELNQELRYIVVDEAAQHGNDAQATWMALQMNPETADLELSIEQVQEILNTTPDKTTEIDRITDERMNTYIQQQFKITPEEMGLKASRNSSKVKALLAESLMRDGKTIRDFDAAYSDLLAAADAQVAKASLSRLADSEYWNTLEARAVERYAFALANADNKAMAETRKDQAIVNAIRMRAEAITNKARRFQETAESFRGAQKKIRVFDGIDEKTGKKKYRSEFKYGAYDYDLLQSMLEKFGFDINYARRRQKPVAEKLDDWIMEQEATTITRAPELRNFISFVDAGHDGTFTSMTGADFEKLDSVFNAVKSVAGARYAIVLENERVLLSQMVADTANKFNEMGISAFDKKDNYWAKHFGTIATWTNPEPIVRALFPRKVLDNVWLPFIDAAAKAERYGRQWVERYRTAKAKVDLSNKVTTYSNGKRLSNQQVADLFLSMGNEHAYENFRKALGVDETQAETIVSEALAAQPELATFVNEVWATYGDATTILDKEFQERTNTLFVEKSHREFEINGIKFGGGYVPVRKQLDYVPTDVRAGNQGGMVHDKKFEKLVVAEADGNVRSIVDITENELFQSAKQGYTAVEYNNARKLLLADGMRQTIGERAFSFLDGWLASYMMPKYDTSAWVRPLAALSSTGALGFRVSTALLQLSGLVPAMIATTPKYFARGLHMAMKNGEWAPVYATRKGADKSDYMAVRIGDPRSSLLGQSIMDAVRAENANTKLGKAAKFLASKVGNAAMWGIQQVDTAVANVTWNAAYLKALDEGLSEVEARREADSIVRTVQSDSMQISRSQGLQSQYARMFTAFATWIMAMQSQLRANIATRDYAKAAVWAATYMVLSPIFESFLKEATRIGGSDDDKDYIERVLKTCYNEISSTIGTSVIPPASLGGAALTAILSGIEEGLTGEKEHFEVRQSNMPALQTAYRGLNAVRYGIAGVAAGDEEKLGKAATYAASTVSTEVGRLVKYLLAE